MRVALFGGTFDPPHRAHLTVARAAAAKFSLDTIFFAPTGRQPLKPRGAIASFDDRLAMVALLCNAAQHDLPNARFMPSTLDAPRADGKPNYTIDTLTQLRAELQAQSPKATPAELFVIIGADAFLDLRRWRDPDALLQAAEWIVVSRPGFSLTSLAPLALTPEQNAKIHLLPEVQETASASEVRERLQAGLDCSAFLTPEVIEYIRDHHLYLSQTSGINTL
jgi:nicotinate-nucleotide adenylyltransferase